MRKRKTLQDLTIKDNFLFGAVMRVEENCRGFLEMVLGFPIAHVVVSKERDIVYHPEYRGGFAGACQIPGICDSRSGGKRERFSG